MMVLVCLLVWTMVLPISLGATDPPQHFEGSKMVSLSVGPIEPRIYSRASPGTFVTDVFAVFEDSANPKSSSHTVQRGIPIQNTPNLAPFSGISRLVQAKTVPVTLNISNGRTLTIPSHGFSHLSTASNGQRRDFRQRSFSRSSGSSSDTLEVIHSSTHLIEVPPRSSSLQNGGRSSVRNQGFKRRFLVDGRSRSRSPSFGLDTRRRKRETAEEAMKNSSTNDKRVHFYLHESNSTDYRNFKIDELFGNISTTSPIHKKLGSSYRLLVVAKFEGKLINQEIEIEVTNYNQHAPRLEQTEYSVEIFSNSPPDTLLLTASSLDNDEENYNNEPYYYLLPEHSHPHSSPPLHPNDSIPFSIDHGTGEVRLRRSAVDSLSSLPSPIELQIAVSDKGSPRRSSLAPLIVYIRDIPEPQNPFIKEATESSFTLCWDAPSSDSSSPGGYTITYLPTRAFSLLEDYSDDYTEDFYDQHPASDQLKKRRKTLLERYHEDDFGHSEAEDPAGSRLATIRKGAVNISRTDLTEVINSNGGEAAPLLCALVGRLRAWVVYSVQVRAWERERQRRSMPSQDITVTTRNQYCSKEHKCGSGGCTDTPSPPGYICSCPPGYYGNRCAYYDPCHAETNPCHHGGTCRSTPRGGYQCLCAPGYLGPTCETSNPCHDKWCGNGGSCVSSPDGAKCVCQAGYLGDSCQVADPCQPRNPCLNGGLCQPETRSRDSKLGRFRCNCTQDFSGRICQVKNDGCSSSDGICRKRDVCSSSPCLNSGKCVRAPKTYEGFICNCLSGYSGKTCDTLVTCRAVTTHHYFGSISWPASHHGQNITLTCPEVPPRRSTMKLASVVRKYTSVDRHKEEWMNAVRSKSAKKSLNIFDVSQVTMESTTTEISQNIDGNSTDLNSEEMNPDTSNRKIRQKREGTIEDGLNFFAIPTLSPHPNNKPNSPTKDGKQILTRAPRRISVSHDDSGISSSLKDGVVRVWSSNFSMTQYYNLHIPKTIDKAKSNRSPSSVKNSFDTNQHTGIRKDQKGEVIEELPRSNNKNKRSSREAIRNVFENSLLTNRTTEFTNFTQDVESTTSASPFVADQLVHPQSSDLSVGISKKNSTTGSARKSFATRQCVLSANGEVSWLSPAINECEKRAGDKAKTTAQEILTLTASTHKINSMEFANAVKDVEYLVDYAVRDENIAKNLITSISNLMSVDSSVIGEADMTFGEDSGVREESFAANIIQSINRFSDSIELGKGEEITIASSNLVVKAQLLDHTQMKRPVSFGPKRNSQEHTVTENSNILVSMELPPEALQSQALNSNLASENAEESASLRVKFVLYDNSKFFRGPTHSQDLPVVAASVGDTGVYNLSNPVSYSIQGINIEKSEPVCVYWDEEYSDWSTEGVVTVATESKGSSGGVSCQAYHLTAFSVLLNPMDEPLEGIHAKVLSIVTYTGLAMSSVALVFTIITYSIFRNLRRDHSGKILLNLSLALLFLNISFVMASELPSLMNFNGGCIVLAALLHYTVVSAFSWMFVEAANMHQLIVTVFASSESKFMVKRLIAAWCFPAVCVIVSLCWDTRIYGNRLTGDDVEESFDICMPHSTKAPATYYTTYLGPICLVMFMNTIVFLRVLRVLCQQSNSTRAHSISKRSCMKRNVVTRAQIRGAITVVSLLGITWIVGPFSIGYLKLPFHYLFSITTPLQGLIIFIVRVLQHNESRNSWLNFFKTGSLRQRPRTPHSSFHTNSSANMNTNSNTLITNGVSPKSSLTMSSSGSVKNSAYRVNSAEMRKRRGSKRSTEGSISLQKKETNPTFMKLFNKKHSAKEKSSNNSISNDFPRNSTRRKSDMILNVNKYLENPANNNPENKIHKDNFSNFFERQQYFNNLLYADQSNSSRPANGYPVVSNGKPPRYPQATGSSANFNQSEHPVSFTRRASNCPLTYEKYSDGKHRSRYPSEERSQGVVVECCDNSSCVPRTLSDHNLSNARFESPDWYCREKTKIRRSVSSDYLAKSGECDDSCV